MARLPLTLHTERGSIPHRAAFRILQLLDTGEPARLFWRPPMEPTRTEKLATLARTTAAAAAALSVGLRAALDTYETTRKELTR